MEEKEFKELQERVGITVIRAEKIKDAIAGLQEFIDEINELPLERECIAIRLREKILILVKDFIDELEEEFKQL